MARHDDEPPRPRTNTQRGTEGRPSTAPPSAYVPRPLAEPEHDEDDGDFEGDDPPTTAEPVRDDHHPRMSPRAPSIPTRPIPKFRSDDAFDDDANPTMIDPHNPAEGPRTSFDPYASQERPFDPYASQERAFDPYATGEERPTMDLSASARRASASPNAGRAAQGVRSIEPTEDLGEVARRALEPTADLGPAARRAFGEGSPGIVTPRDVVPTAPIRRPEGPRNPPSPTGPMLRPPPSAPPLANAPRVSASGAQRAIPPSVPPPIPGAARTKAPSVPPLAASGSQRAIAQPPPAFVTDRRAALGGHPADDSSRTHRWEGPPSQAGPLPTAPQHPQHPQLQHPQQPQHPVYPQAPPGYAPAPMQVISHKPMGTMESQPMHQPRAIPQVHIRSMAELNKTPPVGLGRLAPPRDPNQARTRKMQDVMIWGSVVVIMASIVTLVIWLIAR